MQCPDGPLRRYIPRSFVRYKTTPLGPWPYGPLQGEIHFFQSSLPGEHANSRWSSQKKYIKKFRGVQNNPLGPWPYGPLLGEVHFFQSSPLGEDDG